MRVRSHGLARPRASIVMQMCESRWWSGGFAVIDNYQGDSNPKSYTFRKVQMSRLCCTPVTKDIERGGVAAVACGENEGS